MTSYRPLPSGFLLLAALACSSATEPAPVAFQGTLAPIGTSTVEGTVAAIAHIDRTRTSISVRQAEPGVTYAWGIYLGTCASRGELQGGAAVYTPLAPGGNGMATADATLSVLFDRGGGYAAWVERDDGSVAVACGELEVV